MLAASTEFPEQLSALLCKIAHVAGERPIFAVGGLLRDQLLERPLSEPIDLDVVVEGNALELAGHLAAELHAELVAHPRFLTSTLTLPHGLEIDVATARTETYPRPGALPVVQPGTLRQDLWRRDFTINSLAAPITAEGFGPVIDLTEGQADLRRQIVRVLHPGSFTDDPTRIFRAVRFEQRFGFQIDAETLRQVDSALAQGGLTSISRERVRNELILGCQEVVPLAVIGRLQQLQVLPRLGFAARWSKRRMAFLSGLHGDWKTWMHGVLFESNARQRRALIQEYRLGLDCSGVAWPGLLCELSRPALANNRLYALLHQLNLEELSVLEARLTPNPVARGRLDVFLRRLGAVKPLLRGQHLIEQGLTPGPQLGEWLRAGFAAQLDLGWTEVEQALAWLRGQPQRTRE